MNKLLRSQKKLFLKSHELYLWMSPRSLKNKKNQKFKLSKKKKIFRIQNLLKGNTDLIEGIPRNMIETSFEL